MLGSLSDQVRECLRHAEDCVQQAASQTDPKLRQDFLIIGACWLKLSSELSELLANFSKSKSTEPPPDRVTAAVRQPANQSLFQEAKPRLYGAFDQSFGL
jgi:hypothetical protein